VLRWQLTELVSACDVVEHSPQLLYAQVRLGHKVRGQVPPVGGRGVGGKLGEDGPDLGDGQTHACARE
jgi:hypothetical protein